MGKVAALKLTWVNHSSFLIEHSGIGLLCDPWLDGYVFHDSWALLSPTRFTYDDFARVTHIWFSHEHPDHFFPPNLKKIPDEVRRSITVLYQPTELRDGRLLKFCRNLGFKAAVELPAGWSELGSDFQVFCQPAERGDSWLAMRLAGRTLLNLNDCVYPTEQSLAPVKALLGSVDALMTQFSFASRWGNPDEDERWRQAAKDMLLKIQRELNVLEPKRVLLSASFVYFCHEENQYMNKHMNRVSDVCRFVSERGGCQPVVLYPGDEWSPDAVWDNTSALRRYEADYDAALRQPVKVRSSSVELDKLLSGGASFIRTLRRTNSLMLLGRTPAATIDVRDLGVSLRLDARGMRKIGRMEESRHDVALSSSALLYCLRFPWGGETLIINGRYYTPVRGDRAKFFRWFHIARLNSRGTYYDRAHYVSKVKSGLHAAASRLGLRHRSHAAGSGADGLNG